jgi:Tfp pilus assembly protein PilV
MRSRRRRGTTLIELSGCVAMLVIAMAMIAELVVAMASETKSLDRQAMALRETDNALERLVAVGPSAWKSTPASTELLSDEARTALPNATLETQVDPESEGLIRLSVVARWEVRPGVPGHPIRLTTWGAAP